MASVVKVENVIHQYGTTQALSRVSLDLPVGKLIGLIGPDSAGKSTLLGLISGARRVQTGKVETLGQDMSDRRSRRLVSPRISYMPQGLGKNLYMSLSIQENLEFFGRLHGLSRRQRKEKIARLLDATGLTPFAARPVGKLSGGMKQKLGLCCALIHDPDLLILDEPTTGVDPLSRRQFWTLIDELRSAREDISVLVATAYMEEAERFDNLVALNDGQVLATGSPQLVKAKTGTKSLEEAFVALLPEEQRAGYRQVVIPPLTKTAGVPAISAEGLTRRFGAFTAVDHASFSIDEGEIYGFIGPNGSGKTTTIKMLTGLLPPSEGTWRLFGKALKPGDRRLRSRIGYMSQGFSLYTELSVRQNLTLHARLFHIAPGGIEGRLAELAASFDLGDHMDQLAHKLPLGVLQRLSLAVAVIHEPELLILDEPTSGVDPVARERFWEILAGLSRNQGITILVSTHFMGEAARCDRVALMNEGRVLGIGKPGELAAAQSADDLETAFIRYIEKDTQAHAAAGGPKPPGRALAGAETAPSRQTAPSHLSFQRLFAYSLRETMELLRDPIRLSFAILGTAILMLIFGYGISLDVEDIAYAALDRDQTPQSRTYLENLAGSRYFLTRPPLGNSKELERRLKENSIVLGIEIPEGFGRNLQRGRSPEVSVWIDGAMPFRAETVRGYMQGLHASYLVDLYRRQFGEVPAFLAATIETRFRYNQAFESIYAMVPGVTAILLIFIPSLLTAVGVVREKELGSITNFYVTPTTAFEFLLGKQLPYIVVSFLNFLLLVAMAVAVFGVPVKGSFLALALAALLYVTVTTGFGLLVSTFTRTQIAALVSAAILTMTPTIHFSGLMQPVASLEGPGRIVGELWPTSYFIKTSVGVFTKALSFADAVPNLLVLALFVPVIVGLSIVLLPEQDR